MWPHRGTIKSRACGNTCSARSRHSGGVIVSSAPTTSSVGAVTRRIGSTMSGRAPSAESAATIVELDRRGEISAAGPGFGSVGLELRVDEDQRANTIGMAGRDMLRHIPAHREAADDGRLGHMKRVEHGHAIIGELRDAFGPGAMAPAEATLVGHDQPHALGQRLLSGPHRVVEWEAVQQHERHAAAAGVYGETRVAEGDEVHGNKKGVRTLFQAGKRS